MLFFLPFCFVSFVLPLHGLPTGFLFGSNNRFTLSGVVLGFLPYNSHPASVFMGDCGALFLGFTLACMSLLGFKTTAIITLGFPVLMLFIPISDTLIAMIRRKLKGILISILQMQNF